MFCSSLNITYIKLIHVMKPPAHCGWTRFLSGSLIHAGLFALSCLTLLSWCKMNDETG